MSTLAAAITAESSGARTDSRLSAPAVRRTTPAPIRALLDRALLADLPDSFTDLQIDTDARPGIRKILLAFAADRAEIDLFCALSPALTSEEPSHLGAPAGDEPRDLCDAGRSSRRICDEPDFPWWAPPLDGPGRRYACSTAQFDFVEVIVDERRGRVFIRSID